MLEIVRDRTWEQYHTFYDSPGVPSDLSDYTFVCQIRKSTAVRNADGIFVCPLVVDVEVVVTDSNVVAWSLTRSQTAALSPTEKYHIDMVGTKNGVDEAFINPEPIKVVNRPSVP